MSTMRRPSAPGDSSGDDVAQPPPALSTPFTPPATGAPEGRTGPRVAPPVSAGRSSGRPAARPRSAVPPDRSAGPRATLAAVSWAAVVVVLLVFAGRPPLRTPLLSVLALGYLLVLWFFLARTKTLSWTSLSLLFALGVPWAVVAALALAPLAGSAGVAGFGASTALAGVGEQALTLVPVLALAVIRPARVRAFSAADWLLAGLTAGLSFQVAQELARQHAGSYSLSPLAGGATVGGGHFAGRPVLAAAVTATLGLALAAWRHCGQPLVRPMARGAGRALALVAPLGVWWLAAAAQAGFDATAMTGSRWLSAAGATAPTVPWLLRAGWRMSLHGSVFGGLLVLLLILTLLVDAARLRNAGDQADDPLPQPFAPARRADEWAGRLTRWAGTSNARPVALVVWVIAAGCAALAYGGRDLAVVLVCFRPEEPRPAPASAAPPPPGTRARVRAPKRQTRAPALARGRAAAVMVRAVRADAMAMSAGTDDRPARRATRLTGLAGLLLVLTAAFGLAPYWAAGSIDPVVPAVARVGGFAPVWLAGALARFGPWWTGQSLPDMMLAALGFVAVLLLAAGPLDLSLGSLANSPFLADRASGRPESTPGPAGPGPAGRTLAYLGAGTPAELLADGAGALAGLLPLDRVKPPVARAIRTAADEFANAPGTFVVARRAAARRAAQFPNAADVTAPIRIRTRPDLPAIKLADGRLISAMTDPHERLFIATLDDLTRGNIRVHNEAADYQVRIYGDDERLVSRRPERWSDGQNTAYGMVCDAIWFDGEGASWFAPETLPETIRHKAYLEIDRRLLEYAAVVYYPASPFLGLEITTNNPQVARTLRERMERLAIPGYVVLEA